MKQVEVLIGFERSEGILELLEYWVLGGGEKVWGILLLLAIIEWLELADPERWSFTYDLSILNLLFGWEGWQMP